MKSILFAWLILLTFSGCRPSKGPPPLLDWQPVDTLNARLPPEIRVYSGSNPAIPLSAWYASIDLNSPEVSVHIERSDDSDAMETVAEFAQDPDVCVAVNGGYFRADVNPAAHVGLLMSDGHVLEPAIGSILRESLRYPTARATMGITQGGRVHFAWVNSRNDSTIAWPSPPPNQPGSPAVFPDLSRARSWQVRDAVSAGPRLLVDGAIRITAEEEVFFGSSIPDIHPRTAAGVTADGDLILMVVDGRQRASRGVNLQELAVLLASTGAVDGMNLDGGGSSTIVVNGQTLNLPAGEPVQRQVMSAITIECTGSRRP